MPAATGRTADARDGDNHVLFVVWYRWNDLRLADHEPLVEAEKAARRWNDTPSLRKQGRASVLHLHIMERELIAGRSREAGIRRCSHRRALFWAESVEALAGNLRASTAGGATPHALVVGVATPGDAEEDDDPIVHYRSAVEIFRSLATRLAASGSHRIAGVYSHMGFCDEETQTEGRVQADVLDGLPHRPELHLYWGGQTMHHLDDLGIQLARRSERVRGGALSTTLHIVNLERVPEFKGQFNGLCKGKRIREPLPSPYGSDHAANRTGTGTGCDPATLACVTADAGGGVEFHAYTAPPPSGGDVVTSTRDSRIRAVFEEQLGTPSGFLEAVVEGFNPSVIAGAWPENAGADAAADARYKPFGRSTFLCPPAGGAPAATWCGGEAAAHAYLRRLVWKSDPPALMLYKGATESFNHAVGEADNTPINAGTRLSPYFAFGCLTVRQVMAEVRRWEKADGGANYGKQQGRVDRSVPPTKRLYGELIFRDFLRVNCLRWGAQLFKIGGPFGTEGVPWRRPLGRDRESVLADYRRWQTGRTGIPFVDAGMRELALTGYMSHLHRQCCASFLVRDLGIDWRMGAEHFEACLLDHTPDANWGNWAYRILPRPCLVPNLHHMMTGDVAGVLKEFAGGGSRGKGKGKGGSKGGKGGGGRGGGGKKGAGGGGAVGISVVPGSDAPPSAAGTNGHSGAAAFENIKAVDQRLRDAGTRTQTTVECTVWPMVHDSFAKHLLAWLPELRGAAYDGGKGVAAAAAASGKAASTSTQRCTLNFLRAREPWAGHVTDARSVDMKPYRDSPLWFCAANRANWDYEYYWFSGCGERVVAMRAAARKKTTAANAGATPTEATVLPFELGRDYPAPMVLPIVPTISTTELPVNHCWDARERVVTGELLPVSQAAMAAVEAAVERAVPPAARPPPARRAAAAATRSNGHGPTNGAVLPSKPVMHVAAGANGDAAAAAAATVSVAAVSAAPKAAAKAKGKAKKSRLQGAFGGR